MIRSSSKLNQSGLVRCDPETGAVVLLAEDISGFDFVISDTAVYYRIPSGRFGGIYCFDFENQKRILIHA
jgi:hypothetical protein